MKLLAVILTVVLVLTRGKVSCLETVSVVTDGVLYVHSNCQDVRLKCDFTVSLRTALRVRWLDDRNIVVHYEENIMDVARRYQSFVKPIGNLENDDAAILLNVKALHEDYNLKQVTFTCLVHIYNGTSSQISFKNTTVYITGNPSITAEPRDTSTAAEPRDTSTSAESSESCDDELLLIEKRRLEIDTLRLDVERERLVVEQGHLTLERERLVVEQSRLTLERERLQFERKWHSNP